MTVVGAGTDRGEDVTGHFDASSASNAAKNASTPRALSWPVTVAAVHSPTLCPRRRPGRRPSGAAPRRAGGRPRPGRRRAAARSLADGFAVRAARSGRRRRRRGARTRPPGRGRRTPACCRRRPAADAGVNQTSRPPRHGLAPGDDAPGGGEPLRGRVDQPEPGRTRRGAGSAVSAWADAQLAVRSRRRRRGGELSAAGSAADSHSTASGSVTVVAG